MAILHERVHHVKTGGEHAHIENLLTGGEHLLAHSVEQAYFLDVFASDIQHAAGGIRINADGIVNFFNAGNITHEEIVDFSGIVDVIGGRVIPGMVAAIHLDECGFGVIVTVCIEIFFEGKVIAGDVREIGDRGGGGALVEVAPKVDGGFCTEADACRHYHYAEVGVIVTDSTITGTVDVHGADIPVGGERFHFVANGAADGSDGGDAVAVLDGQTVGHESAHGETGNEYAVLVDIVIGYEVIEDGHHPTGVIHAVVDDDVAAEDTGADARIPGGTDGHALSK